MRHSDLPQKLMAILESSLFQEVLPLGTEDVDLDELEVSRRIFYFDLPADELTHKLSDIFILRDKIRPHTFGYAMDLGNDLKTIVFRIDDRTRSPDTPKRAQSSLLIQWP